MCASPVLMVSGPLGALRVDVRLTYIPDAGDLGHINPRRGGGVLGRKSTRGKEGGLWRGGGEREGMKGRSLSRRLPE